MAMPSQLRNTRGYRSRYINVLNEVVKSIAPIAGKGIRLRQTAQGTVIEVTAKSAAAEGTPTPTEILPFDLALQEVATGSSGTEAYWCAYLPSWRFAFPLPNAEADDPTPWDCVVKSGTLTQASPASAPSGWVPILPDADLQALTSCTVAVRVEPLVTGAWEGDLPIATDTTGTHPSSAPGVVNADTTPALWLPFGVLATQGGRKVLRNIRRGALANDLAAGSCDLCHQTLNSAGVPTGKWERITSSATLTDYERYALAAWYALTLRWGTAYTDTLDLRPLALAQSGVDCVTHAADHLGGVL